MAFPQPIGLHGHGRPAGVEILRIGGENLAILGSMMSHQSRAGCRWLVGKVPLKVR
jgi:hypothetical protein